MSKKLEERLDELHRDIQNINNMVQAIALDVTQNRNLTLATSHYLEEIAEMVRKLENSCPGVDTNHQ
jgi:ACT domain-containing protein